MRPNRLPIVLIICAALSLFAGAAHGAGENYTFALSIVAGGTSDADIGPDPDFDNIGVQALFGLHTDRGVLFTVRAGQLPLDTDELGGLFDSDLRYLVLAGEYRFPASFYESGLFIGLGAYNVEGGAFIEDETSVGLALGVTADFALSDRFSVLAELAGHFTDLDYAGVFLTGGVGVAYRF